MCIRDRIYGMGHAVYSISDPRATIFRGFVERLAKEKDKEEEFAIYAMVERMAPEIISRERKIYKGVSPNVDFYSGLTYSTVSYTHLAKRLPAGAHSGRRAFRGGGGRCLGKACACRWPTSAATDVYKRQG